MSPHNITIHEPLKLELSEQEAIDLDDERRKLPHGWVRAFDPSQKEHFYVDTATNRSSWIHPYDDPEYLRTLPTSDPANPESIQAITARQRAEHENEAFDAQKAAAEKGDQKEHKGFFAKAKDMVSGKNGHHVTEEQKKAARAAEDSFRKRRSDLTHRKADEKSIKNLYAEDPFGFTPPTDPFSRKVTNPVGYGYSEGYDRRYSPIYGFGPRPYKESWFDGVFINSIVAQQGVVAGYGPNTNYGFGG